MDGFRELANAHGLYLIEDRARAHGARYRSKSVASLGDIAAWSFCQDKIMSTGGEGCMVTTDSRNWWTTMWGYKDHGSSYSAVYEREPPRLPLAA
jgi:dTDP-4-amino-4,6-dideoxygalactose transaminase